MQIVIDISEDLYKSIICHKCKIAFQQKCDYEDLKNAIEDGTPLPKGHGRLGDLDVIWNKLKELEEHYQEEFIKDNNIIRDSAMGGRLYGFSNAKFIVQDTPTIIEADKDKAESEED